MEGWIQITEQWLFGKQSSSHVLRTFNKTTITVAWRDIHAGRKWTQKQIFLPPAIEVWGKVIFSEACVILFTWACEWCHFLSDYLVPCSFWEGGLCAWSHVPWGGGLCPGGVSIEGGGHCLGGLCPGESLSGRPPDRDPLRHTVKSGRYASYWNAFLFSNSITSAVTAQLKIVRSRGPPQGTWFSKTL